jgi:hypothetical protein
MLPIPLKAALPLFFKSFHFDLTERLLSLA